MLGPCRLAGRGSIKRQAVSQHHKSAETLDLGPDIQHIQNMPNLSKKSLTADKRGFIDEFASLLAPWGMPQTAARLYGYLLLSAVPVSLDRIATDLQVSKSS